MLAAQGGVVGFQSAKESKYNRDKFEVGELTISPDCAGAEGQGVTCPSGALLLCCGSGQHLILSNWKRLTHNLWLSTETG